MYDRFNTPHWRASTPGAKSAEKAVKQPSIAAAWPSDVDARMAQIRAEQIADDQRREHRDNRLGQLAVEALNLSVYFRHIADDVVKRHDQIPANLLANYRHHVYLVLRSGEPDSRDRAFRTLGECMRIAACMWSASEGEGEGARRKHALEVATLALAHWRRDAPDHATLADPAQLAAAIMVWTVETPGRKAGDSSGKYRALGKALRCTGLLPPELSGRELTEATADAMRNARKAIKRRRKPLKKSESGAA